MLNKIILILIFLWCALPTALYSQTTSFGNMMGKQNLPSALGQPNTLKNSSRNNNTTGSNASLNGGSVGNSGSQGGGEGFTYQVHVLGQVQKPGTYYVGPSVRLAEVVSMAGDVVENGSLRNIKLRREDGETRFDLLAFRLKGDLRANPFLQDNDVIFVPFKGTTIRVEGSIKESGIYELTDNEKTLWDVIQLAGSYTTGASYKGDVVVIRYDEKEEKKEIKVTNVVSELNKTRVESGDIIIVPHILTNGRKFDYAFQNFPADNVFYPTSNDNIFVGGAVNRAGPIPYNSQLGIIGYINMAGGPTQLGKVKKARVITPEGKTINKTKRYALNPGDTIIVPERKMTGGNALTWFNTFTGTVFTGVALQSLIQNY